MITYIKKIVRTLRRLLNTPYPLWLSNIGHSCKISKNYISLPLPDSFSIGCGSTIMDGFRIETVKEYAGVMFTPHLRIGDHVNINQNFHCTCADSIEIKSGVSITANCGVFDIIHPYENIKENPRYEKIKTAPIVIGEDSLIGMNSVIMPGVHLGKHTIVGANSTIMKGCYPDYVVLAGSPARIIKKYCEQTGKWEIV